MTGVGEVQSSSSTDNALYWHAGMLRIRDRQLHGLVSELYTVKSLVPYVGEHFRTGKLANVRSCSDCRLGAHHAR